jgi:hypothetical protein
VTGLLDLSSWPAGKRVIVRKERPHPGAQLWITDADGHRVTAFATNTGLTNLPLHEFTQNQLWCAIVALAVELTAWMQMLALAGHDARRWEPKRLRLRLFSIAARLTEHGRTQHLHLSTHAPWAGLLAQMITTLQGLPAPGWRTLPGHDEHQHNRPVEPARTRATSGPPSHPWRRISPRSANRNDLQRDRRERFGLIPIPFS